MRMKRRALALALATAAISGAASGEPAKPKVEMHRTQVAIKDADGWYPAKSTRGRFSVLSPIPFNDYSITFDDPNIGELVLHGVGGKSADGMEFGAIETVRTARQKDVDLRQLVANVAAKQGAAVPEVRPERVGDEDVAHAEFQGRSRGVVMRASKTQVGVYTVVCEYPGAIAEQAKPTCRDYVASFRVED
ncbi:hypothetical protein ACFSCV_14385 [Methylopila henanensis]|uniref:DUF1795 domain-containing protein n=1 Tax=Methylopila henanensis TaxID=873516 RepID=A0ABW4K7Q0_9HYPH